MIHAGDENGHAPGDCPPMRMTWIGIICRVALALFIGLEIVGGWRGLVG